MKCDRPTCPRAACIGKFCDQHHALLKAQGLAGYTSSGPVMDHIVKLKALGWSSRSIGFASGVPEDSVRSMLHRRTPRCWRVNADRILALPLITGTRSGVVPPLGAIRRVNSLRFLGWRLKDIAERGGLRETALRNMLHKKTVPPAVDQAVRAVYPAMSMTPGPCKHTAGRARNAGYVSPWAWDDIDDDTEVPNQPVGPVVDEVAVQRAMQPGGDPSGLTQLEKRALARAMAERGAAISAIATRLRWSHTYVQKAVA